MSGGEQPPEAGRLVATLRARRETLAVAESLTGGLLAATLVDVPGASAVFRGGLVVYATDLKETLAGVDPGLLDAVGAVHPEVAVALAAGARTRCGATWALSTTGVAGPGAVDGHPPGTVFVGLAGPTGDRAHRLTVSGSRRAIRRGTVAAAVRLLGEELARSS